MATRKFFGRPNGVPAKKQQSTLAFGGSKTKEIQHKKNSDDEDVKDEELVDDDENSEIHKVTAKPAKTETGGESNRTDQSKSLQEMKDDGVRNQEPSTNGDLPVPNVVSNIGGLMLTVYVDIRQTDCKERSASCSVKFEVSVKEDKVYR